MSEEFHVRRELEWIRQLLYTIIVNQETQIMPALDDARASLEQLKTDVQALLDKPTGGVAEVDVQAIADELAALDAAIKAALGQ